MLTVIFSHAPTRHIRRGNHSKLGYLDGHSLLPLCADHAPRDSLEWTGGDNHLVATLEVAVVVREKENVGVIDAGNANEVVHLAVRDDEWRILAVWPHGEVVVIIAEARVSWIVDSIVKNSERGTDEDDIGYQRLGYCLALAVCHSDIVAQWEKDIHAFAFKPVEGFLLSVV